MAKGKLTRKCIKKLESVLEGKELDYMKERINRYLENEATANAMQSLPQKVQEFMKEIKLELEIEVRNKANLEFLTASRKKEVNTRLDAFGQGAQDIIDGLLSLFRGHNRIVEGAKISVDSINRANVQETVTGLNGDLEKVGLLKMFAQGKRDRDMMIAYYDFIRTGKKSGSSEIDTIVRIMHKWDTKVLNQLKSVGAQVELEPGALFRASVDATKVKKMGLEKWTSWVEQHLDIDKMKQGLSISWKEHMNLLFEEQVTGRYSIARGIEDPSYPVGFMGSNAKLAKKVSRRPRLIFKSGAAHHDYITELGDKSFHAAQSTIFSMEHNLRNFSLMRVLGPNPRKLVKTVIEEKLDLLRSKGLTDEVVALEQNSVNGLPRVLDNAYKNIDGTTRIPGNVTGAKIASNSRIIKNVSLLGSIVPRSLTDFATIGSQARFQGLPWGSSFSAIFKAAVGSMSKSEARKFARSVSIGTQSLMTNVLERFGMDQIGSGMFSQVQRAFFKMNLMTPWNDALKSTFALMHATEIGNQAGTAFAKLKKETRRSLEIYGIDKDEWDVMRHTTYSFGDIKQPVITPDRIEELPDDVFEALLRRQGTELDDEKTITSFIEELGEKSALFKKRTRDESEKKTLIRRNVEIAMGQGDQKIKEGRITDSDELGGTSETAELTGIDSYNTAIKDRTKVVKDLEKQKIEAQINVNKLKTLPDAIRLGNLQKEVKDLKDFIAKREGLEKGVRKAEAIQERVTNRSEEPLSPLGKGLLSMKVNKAKRLLATNERIIEKLQHAADLEKQVETLDVEIGKQTSLLNTEKAELKSLRKERSERLHKEFTKDFELSNIPEPILPGGANPLSKFSSPRLIEKARTDLAQKIKVMYQDSNDSAVIIPGSREQAVFEQGTQPGTVPGEGMRFIAQFKTFPLAVYTKHIERDILAGGAKNIKEGISGVGDTGGDLLGVAGLIAGMSFFGGLGVMAVDFTRGREQRDWTKIGPYIEAAKHGGGFALLSSLILDEYGDSSIYQKTIGTLLGPVLNDFPDIVSLTIGAFNGQPKAKKALDLLHSYTPGQNIFYSRAIMDYLIFYNMQEMIDPGSLYRMEKAVKSHTGQEFNIPPSSVIAYGGENPLSVIGNIAQ
jgi:hypothetical protein